MASTDTILFIYISKCSFFFFFICSSLIYYILISVSPPLSPPSPSSPPIPHPRPGLFLPISIQKRADFPEISFKHGIKTCNKTRHKPPYRGWTSKRQPSRRKEPQEQKEKVPAPIVRSPIRTSNHIITYVQRT